MANGDPSTGTGKAVGGDGGIPFPMDVTGASDGIYHWEFGTGIFVKSISVYSDNDSHGIYGLQLSFRNGYNAPMHGTSDLGTYDTLELADNERITRCVLWTNGAGDRLGRIQLETSNGQTWDKGDLYSGTTPNEMDIGSGWLIGCYGASGSDVDNAAFIFLNTIESMEMTNFKYGGDLADFGNINTVITQARTFTNTGGTSDMAWNVGQNITKTAGWEATNSTTIDLGISVSVKAEIPELASGEMKTSFKYSTTASETTSSSESIDLSYSAAGKIAPGESIEVSALYHEGIVSDLPYTCDVTANVNGFTWSFKETGTLSSTSYSHSWVTKKDLTTGATTAKDMQTGQIETVTSIAT